VKNISDPKLVDSSVPSLTELVARAEALCPLIERHAEQGERDRRIPNEVIEALREAGLVRLAVPRRFGGYETNMRTMLEVAAVLGRADGSTAWVANLLNGASYMAGHLPERAQRDVWEGGPDIGISACFAPTATSRRVGDSYVVSGRWAWGSGCLWAGWSLQGIPLFDDSGEQRGIGLALIPMSDLTIEDTWFVAGMRATGSNTLVGEEVVVPSYRVLSFPDAIEHHYPTEFKDEPLYRSAFVSVLTLILVLPQLGMAQAALEHVVESAPRRAVAHTFYTSQVDSTTVQMLIAEAEAKIDTAYVRARRAADIIDTHAADGTYPDLETRGRIRMDTGLIARDCCRAVDILLSVYGASAFLESSPLQRIWRDLNVSARHGTVNPSINQEIFGRVLLGLDPRDVSDFI
jgi:alkylation response protein AidB-like acyl-CoA dehydrogenase